MGGRHQLCAALLSAIVSLCANPPPLRAQVAYIADSQLDTVSAFDLGAGTIAATIPVGPGLRSPCGIALSADGETAYVANPPSDTVSAIDLRDMTIKSIHLSCPPDGCSPKKVIVSPDEQFLYVISENFVNLSITEIDARTLEVTRTFELASSGVSGGCGPGTITPDGRFLYVRVTEVPLALAVVDLTTGAEIARLEDGPFNDVLALPNDTEVLAPGAGRIAVISTETQQVTRVIPVEGAGAIVASSDGSTAYVRSTSGLLVVDVASGRVDATIPLGDRTSVPDIAISPDDKLVLVAELLSQSIIEVDTTTRSIAGSIPLDHPPRDLIVTPDSATVYVTSGDTDPRGGVVSQIDLQSGAVTRLFSPAFPVAVAATKDGTQLFVVNKFSEEVVVVDTRLNRPMATIPVESPSSVALDPDDQLAFVGTGGEDPGSVAVIDRASMTVDDSIPLDKPVVALAIAPDGNRLYAATWIDYLTSSITVIDLATRSPVDTIPLDQPIAELLVAPDGRTLYAAAFKYFLNDLTGGVIAIDLEADTPPTMITTGGVSDMAITPDGRTVYASTSFYDLFVDNPSVLSVIDAEKRSIQDTVEVDDIGPIALDPTADVLIAASVGRPGEITIIDTSSLEISATVQNGLSPSDIAVIGEPTDRICAGDCNADGSVTIAELVRGVGVLLGGTEIDSCPAIDADFDQQVTVADLVHAVTQAMYGCSRAA